MPTFEYTAQDSAGLTIRGLMFGNSVETVVGDLGRKGLTVSSISLAAGAISSPPSHLPPAQNRSESEPSPDVAATGGPTLKGSRLRTTLRTEANRNGQEFTKEFQELASALTESKALATWLKVLRRASATTYPRVLQGR